MIEQILNAIINYLIVLSRDCKCSVALPYGALAWSAVCDCSNSLAKPIWLVIRNTQFVHFGTT